VCGVKQIGCAEKQTIESDDRGQQNQTTDQEQKKNQKQKTGQYENLFESAAEGLRISDHTAKHTANFFTLLEQALMVILGNVSARI
jgi:hypothetical protein